MSTFRERTVTCPLCGLRTEHLVAVTINGERSPEHRARIVAGDFQVLSCQGCGHAAQADGPLLYMELGTRRWIGCYPRAWEPSWRLVEREPLDNWRSAMVDQAPASVRRMADRFIVRTVFGLPALREKLLCMDAGIDDRMLEMLKLDLLRRGGQVPMHPRARPLLVDVTDDALVLQASVPPRETATALGIAAQWTDIRLAIERSIASARLGELRDQAAEWTRAIAAISAGPYVDLGRLMLDGIVPLPAGAELA